MGKQLVRWFLLGTCGCAAYARAWDSAQSFQDAALTYRIAQERCWKIARPSSAQSWRRGVRSIQAACAYHWPLTATAWWEPMLVLAVTEDEFREEGNPHDPSYGRWGVTVPAARWVARDLGVPVPATDLALVRKLKSDDAFNALIAAGELKLCAVRSRGLERAILRYKLGLRSHLEGVACERRRVHWRAILRSWRRSLAACRCHDF